MKHYKKMTMMKEFKKVAALKIFQAKFLAKFGTCEGAYFLVN